MKDFIKKNDILIFLRTFADEILTKNITQT